jgi:3,4-dihydroxy 2-butanone 4-phosphate synthase
MANSNTTSTADIDDVVAQFRTGNPVLIHDAADREGETDFVYPACAVAPDRIARLRNDAGGLICVALADRVADEWELPFLQEILDHPAAENHELEYDERSSFSLTVNHRDARTGITDSDRALTILTLGEAAETPDAINFAELFRAPGHVHLLRAAPGLLADRAGHTELGVALAEEAGIVPAVIVCEMLNDETGRALSPTAAKAYASRNDIPFIEGIHLIEALSSSDR